MRIQWYIAGLLLLIPACLRAQNPVLEEYIQQGINSNQALKQRQLDYNQSLARLKEARGLFFPDLGMQARYTIADGGRVIEFPVGDLLNPVYSTLNTLTGSNQFPSIENETFNFYRPREHETKVTLVQPIFSSDILYNYKISREQAEIARVEMEVYKRELVREIKTAYYTFQKSRELMKLSDTTLLLVKENLRVSERLHENDKVTIDEVYRSEAEVARVRARQAEAKNMWEASRSYFNFLLNRSLDSAIVLYPETPRSPVYVLEEVQEEAVASRQELEQIRRYKTMNRQAVRLEQGDNLPELFGTVDNGFQGEEYSFTGEDDFVLASLVLRWDLFHGLSNRHKVQQRKIEGDKLESALLEAEQKIRMQVLNSYYALAAAYEELEAARKELQSAKRAYDLIRKRYREGQASLLQLLDARTTLTDASTGRIITRSEYFIALADFENAMGKSFNR